jgi:hypothetical protein
MKNKLEECKFECDLKVVDLEASADSKRLILSLVYGAEDDPPLIFSWRPTNLVEFIRRMGIYNGPLVAPINIPANLAIENFQQAILEYLRGTAGSLPRIESVCLPRILRNCLHLIALVVNLNQNPWWNAVDGVGVQSCFPLAKLFNPRPRNPQGILDASLPIMQNNLPFI